MITLFTEEKQIKWINKFTARTRNDTKREWTCLWWKDVQLEYYTHNSEIVADGSTPDLFGVDIFKSQLKRQQRIGRNTEFAILSPSKFSH